MNLLSFNSLFQNSKNQASSSNSHLIKKISSSHELNNKFFVYANVTIYYHSKHIVIPFMILDKERGLYIFEHKAWTYKYLKNATIQKAHQQTLKYNTLAYETLHEIINQKFDEVANIKRIPIYNYLLMENLTTHEYEELDDSLKELMPKVRIVFKDSSIDDVLSKIYVERIVQKPLPPITDILGNLLVQYTILDDYSKLHLCSQEQMNFINSNITDHETLYGTPRSGKTSVLLLKAIYEKLKDKSKEIIIVQTTTLACDILRKRLLEIIEHAIIDIEPTLIKIMTPVGVVNKSLDSQNKREIDSIEELDISEHQKSSDIADLILCDDADFMPVEFLFLIKSIQKRSSLLLVKKEQTNQYYLHKSYKENNVDIRVYRANIHAKTMQIVQKLLTKYSPKDILIVASDIIAKELEEDLQHFVENDIILLKSKNKLVFQDFDKLLVTTYKDIFGLSPKHIILVEPCLTSTNEFSHAFYLSQKSVHIIYEEKCEEIEEYI